MRTRKASGLRGALQGGGEGIGCSSLNREWSPVCLKDGDGSSKGVD